MYLFTVIHTANQLPLGDATVFFFISTLHGFTFTFNTQVWSVLIWGVCAWKSLEDMSVLCWKKASWLIWSLSVLRACNRLGNPSELLHPISRCWSNSERRGVIWFLQETGDYSTQMEEIDERGSLDLGCGCNLNCCWAWWDCLSWNPTLVFISLLIKLCSYCGASLLYRTKENFKSYGQKRTGFCLTSKLPNILRYF